MHKTFPIIDFHCDLLAYLKMDDARTPFNDEAFCSYPLLLKGGVVLQTLAFFHQTHSKSVAYGIKQKEIFLNLTKKYPTAFQYLSSTSFKENSKITILPAIENASVFCTEEEPLVDGLKRLDSWIEELSSLFYISLTWNDENRFGGGNLTNVGLKDDGRRLLDHLSGLNIAIDFSHTSDALAFDILEHIDSKGLILSVIASHSNFRSVHNVPRNLPDDLAREILRRRGVIGINMISNFLGGSDINSYMKHLEHGMALGGEHQLCIGADWFCVSDFADRLNSMGLNPNKMYPDFCPNPSFLQETLHMLSEEMGVSKEFLENFSHKNAILFIQRHCHNLAPA